MPRYSESDIREALAKRILILDGAMGTMIQRRGLTEADFRNNPKSAPGTPDLTNHPIPLKGNSDLLCLTRPDVITEIHREYMEAGADIIETNSFSSNSISQEDYKLGHLVKELNAAAVKCVADAREAFYKEHGESRKIFIAGSLGPTTKTASISPDVNNPAYRATNFDELKECFKEQTIALMKAGADLLLPETNLDTLNVKAAIMAFEEAFEELGYRVPVSISVTITDASGRTLSGQTAEAFLKSVRHANPLSIGINCALGAKDMKPHLAALSRVSDVLISCYP
ncbi:MAG: homocysteine S-methyltransferase family protein, partial [Leptospiraceae bacterium]|nr:homocysteine S-methyltransferase family protein [Leptospiraceae bacterium]